MEDNLKVFIQWSLLILYLTFAAFILVASFLLLRSSAGNIGEVKDPPIPPSPPSPITLAPFDPELDSQTQVDIYTQQVNAYTQQVAAYTQQVSAYTQHIDAYKTFGDSLNNSRQSAVYQLVVKDTLLPILSTFISAFLAYVFVNTSAKILESYIELRKTKQ